MRAVRATRHALVGVMSLWAAAAFGKGQERPIKTTLSLAERAPKEAPPVTHVIVLGDSISQGMGAESRQLSYARLLVHNDDARYPEDAGRDVSSLLGYSPHVINLAHDGDDTADVLRRQLPMLFARLKEEAALGIGGSYLENDSFVVPGRIILVLSAGGNDLQAAIKPNPSFTGDPLKHSLINLAMVLDTMRDKERFPGGVQSYYTNVYDVTDGEDQLSSCMQGMAFPGISEALEVWSGSFRRLEANDARLVDAHSLFRGHGFNYDNPQNPFHDPQDVTLWMYPRDCIHPNNLGHHMLRRAFLQQIERDFASEQAVGYAAMP